MLFSTAEPLKGEVYSFADEACAIPAAGVCLLYPQSGDKHQAVTVPASLALSSYRLVVSPLSCSSETAQYGGAPLEAARQPLPPPISIPLLSIERWRIVVDTSSALIESFARSRHALRKHMAFFAAAQAHTSAADADTATTNGSAATATTSTTVSAGLATSGSRSFYVMTVQTKHVFSVKILFPLNAHAQSILKAFKDLMVHEIVSQQGRLEAVAAFPWHAQKAADEAAIAKAHHAALPEDRERQAQQAERAAWMDAIEFGWTLYHPALEATRQLCTVMAYHADTSEEKASETDCQRVTKTGVGAGLAAARTRSNAAADPAAARPGHDLRALFHWLTVPSDASAYTLSPTYPRQILEPLVVHEALVRGGLVARGRARLPAITFVHLGTGAVLARASQPLGRSSNIAQDTQICRALIRHTFDRDPRLTVPAAAPRLSDRVKKVGSLLAMWDADPTAAEKPSLAPAPSARPVSSLFDEDNPVPRIGSESVRKPSPTRATVSEAVVSRAADQLRVMDCRPRMAAVGNAQMGGGYESGSAYSFCETEFCSIENVFAVCASFQKLRGLLEAFDGEQSDEGFYRRLHDTQWLTHIQRVLLASAKMADVLDRPDGASCLVHCTDGWDRTSQCCAAAQLLLDPFYRTTVGFCILMEKEFASFGHKFAERSAHQRRGHTSYSTSAGVSGSDTEKAHELQVSPVWVQFMDVVFQIVRQFPDDFEFTTALLEHLSTAVYATMHGTFLCNSEQERELEGVRLRTASVWSDVVRRVQAEKRGALPLCFFNATYNADRAWACMRLRPGPPPAQPFTCESAAATTAVAADTPPPATAHLSRTDGLDPLRVNCSAKRIVLWTALYLRLDSDVLMQPRRHARSHASAATTTTTAAVLDLLVYPAMASQSEATSTTRQSHHEPWRQAFEAYLQGFIDHACQRRLEEIARLTRLEASTPRTYVANAQVSAWGLFDPDVCFDCYKLSSSWVGLKKRATCEFCGLAFCSQCLSSHQCIYQRQVMRDDA